MRTRGLRLWPQLWNNQQQQGSRIQFSNQTLPPETWEAFGDATQGYVESLNASFADASQDGAGSARAAYSELKHLPNLTRIDNRD